MPREFARRHVLTGLAAVPALAIMPRPLAAAPVGEFRGTVVARWDDDGRQMTLIDPFEYVDPTGKRWPVPPGTKVDGASIPRFFWTVIGGPFEGRYRNASVVHDFYCQVRTRKFRDVHQVFYNAMRTSGVDGQKSWLMFQAVDNFGPRWDDPRVDPKCEIVDENYDFAACARNAVTPPASFPAADKGKLEDFLKTVEATSDPDDIARLRGSLGNVR